MAANSLDVIMTLGDSLTQGGWEPGGFTQRLACSLIIIGSSSGGMSDMPLVQMCTRESSILLTEAFLVIMLSGHCLS